MRYRSILNDGLIMNDGDLKHSNVLITGGAGNIGTTLAKRLMGHCRGVMVTDNREPQLDETLRREGKFSFFKQDLTKDNPWRPFENKVDLIFHLAAQTSAYRSNNSIIDDWQVNVKPVIQLLDYLKGKPWRPDIIFSSTATVVGLTEKWPVSEMRREVPLTIYDIHKLTVEKYLKFYREEMSGRCAALRLSNVYGPGGDVHNVQDRGIVNQMLRKALHREGLTLYGQGDYVRDYVYIQDVVDAFISAGIHVSQLNGEAYFIGTGSGHTIQQLAEKIAAQAARRTGHNVSIQRQPFPRGALSIEERSFVADIRSFQERTGWVPATDLDLGIALTADYFCQIGV